MTTRTLLLALAALAAPAAGSAQAVPSPASYLGFAVGADRSLADWPRIVGYFGKLAAASPAVKLDTLGPTTLGRPFIVATISSPGNIRRLADIRAAQALLADPRRLTDAEAARLFATQPSVILISCNIHSTEIASSQMAMELAWRLATNDTLQAALRDVVVLLIPSMNPDGEQMVVEWYRRELGTPWEGGPLPWLYQPYTGHDDNRDWFMVTQQETKLVTRLLYRDWFPEVFYDVHQMGNHGARMFVPPFMDPVDPNIDPLIVRGIGQIGAEMAMALQERGKQGVVDHAVYDLWWNGGARSTPSRHNMIGLLTESASVKVATPITQTAADLTGHERGLRTYERSVTFPDPWPGGVWRLRDIVDDQRIAAEALVRLASREREAYVRNFVALARRQIASGRSEAPYAWVIPAAQPDRGAAAQLVHVLRAGGVEVRRALDPIAAGGTTYPAESTWVVRMDQPYRAAAKDLLEVQHYPARTLWPGGPPEPPYDVAGWTLPLQMGVRAAAVTVPLTARTGVPLASDPATGWRAGRCASGVRALDPRDIESYRAVAELLRARVPVRVARGPVTATGLGTVPAGMFLVRGTPRALGADPSARVGCATRGEGGPAATLRRPPRVGVYRPWTANIDEGWTRWVLEQYRLPYASLTDSAVRAGRLRDQYDVILVPDMSLRAMREGMPASAVPPRYAGGLGNAGIDSLAGFVRTGGTLVLLDHASELATEELGVDVRRITPHRPGEDASASGEGARDSVGAEPLYAPGSILRVLVDPTDPVAYGMSDTAAVYFTNSTTFQVAAGSGVRVIARYPERGADILLSGYLQGAQAIAGQAAAVEAVVGRGRVVMFGFRAQHRAQSVGTFRMLFNALLIGGGAAARN